MVKSAAFVVFLLCAGTNAYSQSSATTTATATVVTPITIVKTSDMSFGNLAVHATNPGTVVITPAGLRSATLGVTLPGTSGTVSAPSFTVNGQSGYTYSISLPSSVLLVSGANSMTIDAFTSTPTVTGTLASGTQTLYVGATLNVVGGQAPGVYQSLTPFTVTVNYN